MREMTVDRYIEMFFKKCGLSAKGGSPWHLFWKEAERRDKQSARLFYEALTARAKGEKHSDPYPLKNNTLGLANLVASQYDMERLRAFSRWILKEALDFSAGVLEIGCDNGILLCLLASVHPNHTFIGIDSCKEAIALAKQRANTLKLSNIDFIEAPINATTASQLNRQFGVILASTVFHEIVSFSGCYDIGEVQKGNIQPAFSLEDIDQRIRTLPPQTRQELGAVTTLLQPNGLLVSLDRCPTNVELLSWIRLVEHHGLAVSFKRSVKLAFTNNHYLDSENETLPLTVFEKRIAPPKTSQEILGFGVYPDFVTNPESLCLHTNERAETLYVALAKKPAYSHEAVFIDKSGIERIEIGLAGPLAYLYRTSCLHFRALMLLPHAIFHERFDDILAICRNHRAQAVLRNIQIDQDLFQQLRLPTQME